MGEGLTLGRVKRTGAWRQPSRSSESLSSTASHPPPADPRSRSTAHCRGNVPTSLRPPARAAKGPWRIMAGEGEDAFWGGIAGSRLIRGLDEGER